MPYRARKAKAVQDGFVTTPGGGAEPLVQHTNAGGAGGSGSDGAAGGVKTEAPEVAGAPGAPAPEVGAATEPRAETRKVRESVRLSFCV
jgi:hypothetical protein